MGRENQGTEVSEAPVSNMGPCIALNHVTPGCWGERGAQPPALGAPGSTSTLG